MEKYIPLDALVAEIEKILSAFENSDAPVDRLRASILISLLSFLDSLEVKEVDLIVHTVIAECCDWLVLHTKLNHKEIEDCRKIMLTIKDEQLKTQKGEEYDR